MAGIADDNVLLKREWGTIKYAVCRNGKMPARKFITGLDKNERIRLEILLEWMAKHGDIQNIQKFRHLEGKIWEFKSNQNRMLCFHIGNNWILTHGFKKKGQKIKRQEILRAENIMKEHLER